ncbi:hypothetical protein NX059_007919 [Plenodomus lindquistii]|nr:hypothetical protein NX059_007919 [Plenodomus lindquistii]
MLGVPSLATYPAITPVYSTLTSLPHSLTSPPPPPHQPNQHSDSKQHTKKNLDVGQIRTDAPKGTRFQVLRDRPLRHNALYTVLHRTGDMIISSARSTIS